MKVFILTSGSSGNSTYIETSDTSFLIDAGTNMKYIETKLNNINKSIKDIDFIILSHAHSDHTSALNTILNKYNTKLYLTKNMMKELPFLLEKDYDLLFDEVIAVGNTVIKTIKTSHDAIDSRGFYIEADGKSLVSITDTGYLKAKYLDDYKNKDMYIMESNYNVEKLRHGKYPLWLQARITSPKGHLSNEMSSSYLVRLIGDNTKQVVLAHISHENNTEELAKETLEAALKEYEIDFNNIICAHQKESIEVIEI